MDGRSCTRLTRYGDLTHEALEPLWQSNLPRRMTTNAEKDDLTDWSETQDSELQELGDQFTEYNGRIANVLAAGYRQARGDPDQR